MSYVTRPKSVQINFSEQLGEQFQIAAETVFEERDPVNTGLCDARGDPIYRVPDTVPLGFHHRTPAR
jgi:hypothetical protein